MKRLVLYYSLGGNTESVAEMVARETGAELAAVETEEPYRGTYDQIVDQGQREVEAGFEPTIAGLDVDLADYDVVYLGTPVWWYTVAPAVRTLLGEVDLTGKVVWPFITNGGWPGHALADIEDALPDSDVRPGLNVCFDEHSMRTGEAEVRRWARQSQ